jgi:hypothetical protein
MTSGVGPVSPLPPSGQKPPPVKLDEVLKKLLKQADKDGDGQLDQGEFSAIAGALNALVPPSGKGSPGESTSPSDMFQQADANKDGKISLDELKGFVVSRISQGVQAINQGLQKVQQGKGTVFSAVTGTNGAQLTPDMQLGLMQLNLTQTMAQRAQGAVEAYSGKGYTASAYFKADGAELV